MSTYYLMDTQKSWDDDEWNGWGILSYPSPLAKYPFKFVTDKNTGTIEYHSQSPSYEGYGWADDLDDLTGIYGTPANPSLSKYFWLVAESLPGDGSAALANLATPAVTAAQEECIRMNWITGSISAKYPIVDLYFDVEINPEAYADIVGMKVYVQAAVGHADQTTGIAVYIFDYNMITEDGKGAWEEISGKGGGAPRITTVDADNNGIWGVFEETFELDDGAGGYIDLTNASWTDYIYEYREYNGDDDTGNRKQVVRIALKGLDDCNNHGTYGMNVGCILVSFIRAGTDTNQYLIADTQAPSVLTTETADISATVTASDKYVIAPSIGEIFNDIDHATYGSNNYSFIFKDDTSDGTTVFLAYNFEDQNHFNVLQRISDYANKIWWFDASTSVLHWGEVADLTSSGITLSSSNIPPHAAGLSYPQEDIVWKVIAKGNKTLDIIYTKTATSDSTREITLNLPHITSYSELKKWADNISDKFASRQPKFHCMFDYYSDNNFHRLVPGYSVDVTWKNLSSETLTIQQTTFEWVDGERATIVIDCGIVASPLEMDIGEKFTSIHRRLDEVESMGLIDNYNDPTAVILSTSSGSSSDVGALLANGSIGLTGDWDAGAYEIRAETFESDVTTGTAPFTIASTTVISNLNADLWDGYQFADYIDQAVKQASDVTLNDLTISTPSNIYALSHDSFTDFLATEHVPLAALNADLIPDGNNTRDIGSDAAEFKDIWIDGVGYFDQINMHGHLYLRDNDHLYLGTGNDAYLYHTGAHMYIVNTTGSLFFSAITGDVFIDSVGAFNIRDLDDGSVTLLNLNTSARTLAIGAAADNIATTFYGNISTTGTIKNPADDSGIYTGLSDDLRMYHDASASWIVSSTAPMIIKSSASYAALISHTGAHQYFDCGNIFYWRDIDDNWAIRLQIDSADGRFDVFGGFGAIDVNFANGTTYKVEADGDAVFKDLTATSFGGIASANLVDKSASETIGGEWTYSIFPITPSAAPDADYEVANKKYVDDEISGAGLKTDLDSLDDVTITGAVTGDIIYYNGAAWVDLARGSDGQVLTATAASINWEAAGAADNLGDHTATENLNLVGFSLIGTNFILGNAELNWLEDIYDTGVTAAEFDYLDGVTSNIQTQLDAKVTLTEEQVEDYVGGMLTGNTETLITATYQDDDGTIDFVVDEANIDHDALTNTHNLTTDIEYDYFNDAPSGTIYYEWVSLDPRMHSNTVAVGAATFKHPGYHQMASLSDYVNNQYFYAAGYISVPVGWKCKIVGWRGAAYMGYQDASNYVRWSEAVISVVDINHSTNARTSTTLNIDVNPFTTHTVSGVYAGYNIDGIVERWLYTYDDVSTQVINELNVRYKVAEIGSSSNAGLYLYSHAFKVHFEKI